MDIDQEEQQGQAGSQEWKLRAELHGHQEDVRSVCVGEIGIVTGSRDTTIKLWAEETPTTYALLNTLAGNKSYVNAVAYAPPGFLPGLPNGAVVSGSFDGLVMVWDVASGEAVHTYRGHQYQAAAVVVLPNGDIASGSVDKTIRYWREGRAAGVAEGHEGPVLCLAVTQGGDLISGSGDTTLKRWQGTKCVATYKGHTDTVRGVAILPGVGFVSASHDCSLLVWSLDGATLAQLQGHSAIIYSVAATSSGLIASGSEDNTVRLWSAQGGAALQVLEHPGCVWGVAFTAAGDLVSGCSDAVARVWSSAAERQADADALKAYADLLQERKQAAAAAATSSAAAGDGEGGGGGGGGGLPPGVKVAGAHELMAPGAKDGETKLVREGDGSVAAYGWSAGAAVWEKIGTVVDAPQAGTVDTGRRWYLGREWDRVFDVEMDSGLKLKLAMDEGENPYLVADRFLEQHDLAPEFKEQVVKFILDNTAGGSGSSKAALDGMDVTGGFCDPFTGGSGGRSSRPPPPRPQQQQPQPQQPFSVTGGFCDPFTGGGGAAAPASSGGQLPARVYLLFDGPPPPEGLRKKLLEFNASLAGSGESNVLSEQEAASGGALDQLLASLAPAAAGSQDLALTPELLRLASRLLSWPAPQLFPGLDVARCLALHPAAAAQLAAGAGSMAEPALGALSGGLAAAAASGLGPALQTGLRVAANCFKEAPLRGWVLAQRELLLDGFAGAGGGAAGSKGVRLGLATLLLNYAVAGGGGGGGSAWLDEAAGMQLLSALEDLLGCLPEGEGQAAHRALLALGSLLVAAPASAGLAGVARDLGLAGQVGKWAGAGGELGAAAAEVAALLA